MEAGEKENTDSEARQAGKCLSVIDGARMNTNDGQDVDVSLVASFMHITRLSYGTDD